MSETQSTLFNRRARFLSIAGAFVSLGTFVVVVSVPSPSPPDPEPVKERIFPEQRHVHRTPPAVFETETYYRTIIESNLFRPLGWTPPRPINLYRLIGTVLAIDANTPPQAILQSTTGQKTYIARSMRK